MIDEIVRGSSSQVGRNFTAFQSKLPELLGTHGGKLALMRNEEIVDFFDSYADAVKFGLDKFGSTDEFSVQAVTTSAATLGFYSYALGNVPK